jgi:hypothetical protein
MIKRNDYSKAEIVATSLGSLAVIIKAISALILAIFFGK